MTNIIQEKGGALIWNGIKSASNQHDCLKDFVSSHNLSLHNLKSLKIIGINLDSLNETTFTEMQQLSKLEIKFCAVNKLPLPFQLPPTLMELYLEENEMPIELSVEVFENLPLLEILSLKKNKIQDLQNGVFSSFKNLKRLMLYDNRIGSYNTVALKEFIGLNTLEEIVLEDNEIENCETVTLQELKKIKKVNLSHNYRLCLSPELLSNMSSVEYIEFRCNNTKSLEECHFSTLCNLVRLNLTQNAISTIHKHAFRDLKSLTELYLGGNKISTLNEETFQGVMALKILDLRANDLVKIPPISNLTNLKCLFLQNNKITAIENMAFNGFDGLLTLNFGHNVISQIDKGVFDNLSSLYMLTLGNNELETIKSKTFSSLSQLQFLNLSFNKIKNWETGCFEGLNNLQTLEIAGNSISEVKSHMFQNLTALTTLSLHQNVIKSMEPKAFVQLQNLKSLDLSSNGEVDFNMLFSGLVALEFLDLSSNRLKSTIQKLSDQKLQHLAYLNISECAIDELPLDIFDCFPSLAIVEMFKRTSPDEVLTNWQRNYSGITFLQKHHEYY